MVSFHYYFPCLCESSFLSTPPQQFWESGRHWEKTPLFCLLYLLWEGDTSQTSCRWSGFYWKMGNANHVGDIEITEWGCDKYLIWHVLCYSPFWISFTLLSFHGVKSRCFESKAKDAQLFMSSERKGHHKVKEKFKRDKFPLCLVR